MSLVFQENQNNCQNQNFIEGAVMGGNPICSIFLPQDRFHSKRPEQQKKNGIISPDSLAGTPAAPKHPVYNRFEISKPLCMNSNLMLTLVC